MAKATKTRPSIKSTHKPNTAQKSGNSGGIARPETKSSRILALVSRVEGATLEQLMKETGWQQHSLRGYLSGTVKKRLGYAVASDVIAGARRYKITAK